MSAAREGPSPKNIRLVSALHHWQRFVADLGHILRCPGMDEDVLKAVRTLKRENRSMRKLLKDSK
jgi:hypothetical protein